MTLADALAAIREHQRAIRQLRLLAGRCSACERPRGESLSKRLCIRCLQQRRLYSRRMKNYTPWRRGGPGRPPLGHNPSASKVPE